ncbi:tetratricopeptide repeat-containing sulfotransferase family protein [Nitrospirillum bahiense]|uniref:Tetratricopeptide (TPR) repeat protein n=1 Tax=Nitrospirillum amazonense TaxID=28077 RepID=A0A560FTV6_9PROT|nr:tetratricopeptide repeat-containing sulfotransferase family protein [Nitrospirillum amazonense]TWB24991.1 tetratricopeptide (TPR) repeat protein [Nitrospirillum amazonense]
MNTQPQTTMTVEQALGQAHAHWNAGQADQAERLCQHVLALWPGQSDALHLMGLMAHAYGNLDLAIDHLRRACQAPRVPAVYLSNLGEMLRQRGLLAEAEVAARRAVTMDNALVAGWNNLGIILQEAGKLEDSLTCLERVVALQPNYAEAHNNLGNTLKRMGRLDQARQRYEYALNLAPAYAEAQSNLANLLNDLGRPDEALAAARKAIDLNPRLSDAYINAAAVELGRNRNEDALRWIDALLSYAPLHAGALTVRATALRHLERLEEALADARRAVAQQADNGEAQNVLGEVLQALGQHDEALAAFDKASKTLGFAPEKALINRGVLLMERGDKAEAKAAFEQVVAQFPRSASAWFNMSDLHRFQAGDPAVTKMEALLYGPDPVQSQTDRTALNFALGKAWMDIGDADRAFGYLNEGNRQKRATFAYDAAATGRWMADIAAAFPADALKKAKSSLAGSDQAVFVLGMPRSGTTLIEQILASHPQVAAAGELSAFNNLVNQLGPYPQIAGHLTPEITGGLGQRYLDFIRPLAGGRRKVVDKMPSNFLFAGLINLALPDARIIHVRRDAVDTCLSCYTKLFTREQLFTYDLAELGQFYRAYERLMDHWRAVLPADRFIEVRYEDVVDDQEGQSRRLIEAIGLNWDSAVLDFHKTQRTIRTASLNQVRQPIFRSSMGRWKPFAAQLTPLLTALGIDPNAPDAPMDVPAAVPAKKPTAKKAAPKAEKAPEPVIETPAPEASAPKAKAAPKKAKAEAPVAEPVAAPAEDAAKPSRSRRKPAAS